MYLAGNVATLGFSGEGAALFARMDVQPSAARKILIDQTIRKLRVAGLWDKLELLYFFCAHDAQAARLNWKSSSFDCSAVNSPTFTTDVGYAGNGSSSYLNTGWIPGNSSIFLQNSGSIGCVLTGGTDTAANAFAMGAHDATNGVSLCPRITTSDSVRGRLNNASTVSYGTLRTSRGGFSAINRTASNVTNGYGPVRANNETSASATRPTTAMYICCLNANGTPGNYIDNTVQCVFAGAGLTYAEMTTLRGIISYYLTSVAYGELDRVLADMIALGRNRGTYADGAFLKHDVTVYNSKYYVCHTANTSASNPDTNTAMFVELPLATAESVILDDGFNTNDGAVEGRLTPQGQTWHSTGLGTGNAVVASGYMTSSENTYCIIRGLTDPISEITVDARWNVAMGTSTNTLAISPDPDFLTVSFLEMWHLNWNLSNVPSTLWWHDGDESQNWTTGKVVLNFSLTVPDDQLAHTLIVKLRGSFLFGYFDGAPAFIQCDDLIAILCGDNACSFYVQNHTDTLGNERQERVTVKTATIA